MVIAVIRLKGSVGIRKTVKDALRIMRLKTIHNCIIIQDTPSNRGMIDKVKDYVTYGDITFDVFLDMLKKRGRMQGDKRLTEESVKEMGYDNFGHLATDIFENKTNFKKLKVVKPTFRLTPPSGGFKSMMKQFPKGDLGNRGEAINELLKKMV